MAYPVLHYPRNGSCASRRELTAVSIVFQKNTLGFLYYPVLLLRGASLCLPRHASLDASRNKTG